MAEKVISETTPPLVDKGVTQRQLFLASEIINSKDFASINFVDRTEGGKDDKESSYITHHRPSITTIVTCYRDRPTFYKSSKKLIRAASRIYKAIVGRDVGNICDGYWIGRQPRQGAWQGDDEGHDKALHRRLESELGPCIHDAMKPTFDLSNTRNNSSDGSVEEASSLAISVMKFGSQRCDDRLENPSDRRVGVLFVDLDKVARDHLDCIFDNLSASARCSYNILNNILHWLSTHQHFYQELCWIVHVKSEILHQYVSPSSSGKRTDACAFLVTGEELLRKFASLPSHISTKKSDVAIKDTSNTQNQNTIRRLRDNKEAAHCPLSLYPARYIEIDPTMNESSSEDNNENDRHRTKIREICRFHNYDSERGCLRSKKALEKEGLKGCDMDHEHCHNCGTFGHLAFECPVSIGSVGGGNLEPLVFLKSQGGTVSSTPFHRYQSINRKTDVALPALVVVGGRLRGRTLAACEMLALSSSQTKSDENQWQATPNLLEHRGSHAACSAAGTGLVFALGGGGVDGNLDTVEILDIGTAKGAMNELRWQTMKGRLSSPRHAFGAVACVTQPSSKESCRTMSVSLFAVGGWKYGSISCESVEKLHFDFPAAESTSRSNYDTLAETSSSSVTQSPQLSLYQNLIDYAQWEECAPLLIPRRLHSVTASADASSIYVFGGYINERRTTSSVERYDIAADAWMECDKLPYGGDNCPLVQTVVDWKMWQSFGVISFLMFPYSGGNPEDSSIGFCPNSNVDDGAKRRVVLRYIPGRNHPFSPVAIPSKVDEDETQLRIPIPNWHSFIATSSSSLNKAFLVGGMIDGKWTGRGFELDLNTLEWKELPKMASARRRLATLVVE